MSMELVRTGQMTVSDRKEAREKAEKRLVNYQDQQGLSTGHQGGVMSSLSGGKPSEYSVTMTFRVMEGEIIIPCRLSCCSRGYFCHNDWVAGEAKLIEAEVGNSN